MFDSYIAALHAAALEEKSERRAQRESACRPVQQESPLLDLPPELRNEIYRYTLHASDWLVVDGNMPEEPGLLSACRQIRTEASPIYYFENWFHIWINNYDGEVTWLLRKKWWVYKRPLLFRVEMQAFAKPNWPNLMKWLKEYHGAWYLGFAADGAGVGGDAACSPWVVSDGEEGEGLALGDCGEVDFVSAEGACGVG